MTLRFAWMLAGCLAIGLLAPPAALADDDDDDGAAVTCPCWTEEQARRVFEEALESLSGKEDGDQHGTAGAGQSQWRAQRGQQFHRPGDRTRELKRHLATPHGPSPPESSAGTRSVGYNPRGDSYTATVRSHVSLMPAKASRRSQRSEDQTRARPADLWRYRTTAARTRSRRGPWQHRRPARPPCR